MGKLDLKGLDLLLTLLNYIKYLLLDFFKFYLVLMKLLIIMNSHSLDLFVHTLVLLIFRYDYLHKSLIFIN